MSKGAVVSHHGIAHPWMCDAMGHLNARHYAAMFDDATFHFLAHICLPSEDASAGRGWADVRWEIDFRREIAAGSLLTISTQVLGIGAKSLTFAHTMSSTEDGGIRAAAKVTTARFDLKSRKAISLTQRERDNAQFLQRDN